MRFASLLLPVLLAPIAIGWLVLEGTRQRLHPTSTAIALLVTAVAILQLSVGLVLACRLEGLSRRHTLLLDDSRRAREAQVTTSAIRGIFETDAATRREFFSLAMSPRLAE